ncbi:MAG TPA: hypothetical protein VLG46_14045 [Anaerolineae bacterium]|nr:hypothetical protein [Anaerolineae bacterium]
MEFGNSLGFAFVCIGALIFIGWILLALLGLTVITKDPSYLTDGVKPVFIFMGVAGLLICAALVFSTPDRSFEEVACYEVAVPKHYNLIISEKRNGDRQVSLDERDGRQRHLEGILRYTIVGHYLVGEIRSSQAKATGNDFFWMDLQTNEVRRYAEQDREKFFQALFMRGIQTEPTLTSIEDVCRVEKCVPCSSPRYPREP